MINLESEDVVSLSDAAKSLPRRRGGCKPHLKTLYRWTLHGCRGVLLESIQVGGTRCTSHQAIQRFCDRLSNFGRVDRGPPPRKRPDMTVQSGIDAEGLR